mmetsp:Transcript_21122/g.25998  ORF Transcript_21122/g.25998 Transcript_21122/m.25998 type:complete len:142 (-) Transcript_21122:243-668(-)
MADELFAGWDAAPTVLEDAAKNYTAKQVINETGGCTLIKYRCDGLTAEQWRQDPTAIAIAVNPKLSRTSLPEDEGHKVFHLKMKMPLIISNRSIVTTFYEVDREDGWKAVFHSSKGNEAIQEAQRSAIGKDVVANNVITYF